MSTYVLVTWVNMGDIGDISDMGDAGGIGDMGDLCGKDDIRFIRMA